MPMLDGNHYDTDITLDEDQLDVAIRRGIVFSGGYEVSCEWLTDEEIARLKSGGSIHVDVFVESVGTTTGTLSI